MTKDTETPEHSPPRKPYEGPELKEWGSIIELTGAGLSGDTDVDNNQGSEGV
jgi:hypothetical protein